MENYITLDQVLARRILGIDTDFIWQQLRPLMKRNLHRPYRKLAHTEDNFSKWSPKLRGYFDSLTGDHSSLHPKKFSWDLWHVPNQYRLLRTPAYHYFPQEIYAPFHKELVLWGRRNLGCWDISPPWLSCYVDGCFQEFHRDLPHGPWAYVLSLSPSKLPFEGGQTELLRPEVLSLWKSDSARRTERAGLIQSIEPKFNRLVVFDGRVPHRVNTVRGPLGLESGRLVIHGWFTRPKTFIEGHHSHSQCQRILNQAVNAVAKWIELGNESLITSGGVIPFSGTMGLGLSVNAKGKVRDIQILSNSVVDEDGRIPRSLDKKILQIYSELNFPEAKGSTRIVVPLIFQ